MGKYLWQNSSESIKLDDCDPDCDGIDANGGTIEVLVGIIDDDVSRIIDIIIFMALE